MVHPKKHLGQHFLTDQHTARKIVGYLPEDAKHVLEIGPGKGILTQYLLAKNYPDFRVIEIDAESVAYLQQNFPELSPNIIGDDFLKLDLRSVFEEQFVIVGNFPYNISSQILFRVLDYRNMVEIVVGMFQREVAERIASPPGSKKYGILSVLIQAYYTIEYLTTINEGVFFPPPKVKSAVIRLKRNEVAQLACNEKLFFNVVKTAFNQRRKTLRNALKKFTLKEDHPVRDLLTKRAEQLGVDDFVKITNAIGS